MTVKMWLRSMLLAAAVVFAPAVAPADQPQTDAKDQYVPVDQFEEVEELPAAPLVAGAYGIAWAAVLVYVWTVWRRLAKVDQELSDVARRLETGTRR